ncbi:hypothetical protein FQZ97_253110 [compost metagenome]
MEILESQLMFMVGISVLTTIPLDAQGHDRRRLVYERWSVLGMAMPIPGVGRVGLGRGIVRELIRTHGLELVLVVLMHEVWIRTRSIAERVL